MFLYKIYTSCAADGFSRQEAVWGRLAQAAGEKWPSMAECLPSASSEGRLPPRPASSANWLATAEAMSKLHLPAGVAWTPSMNELTGDIKPRTDHSMNFVAALLIDRIFCGNLWISGSAFFASYGIDKAQSIKAKFHRISRHSLDGVTSK